MNQDNRDLSNKKHARRFLQNISSLQKQNRMPTHPRLNQLTPTSWSYGWLWTTAAYLPSLQDGMLPLRWDFKGSLQDIYPSPFSLVSVKQTWPTASNQTRSDRGEPTAEVTPQGDVISRARRGGNRNVLGGILWIRANQTLPYPDPPGKLQLITLLNRGI